MDSACVYGVAWQNDRRKKCGNAMKGWGGRMLGAEGDKGARENERGNGIERRKKRPLGKYELYSIFFFKGWIILRVFLSLITRFWIH